MIRVLVPATSANLGPGLDCLGLALDWTSEVHLGPAPALQVEVVGEGAGEISLGEDNLVVRSIRRVLATAGRGQEPFFCRIVNRFPLSRGLGSSAAAIVGGAVAANAYLGTPLDALTLLGQVWPLEGHGDNLAPALLGGFTIAGQGRERVFAWRFDPPLLHAALAVPERRLSTRKAREVLPERVPRADAVANLQRQALWFHALCQGDYDSLRDATEDRLHQPYRKRLIPGMEEALQAAQTAGAYGAFLSGAGPTLLALVRPGEGEQVATAMAEALGRAGTPARALAVPLSPLGARVAEGA